MSVAGGQSTHSQKPLPRPPQKGPSGVPLSGVPPRVPVSSAPVSNAPPPRVDSSQSYHSYSGRPPPGTHPLPSQGHNRYNQSSSSSSNYVPTQGPSQGQNYGPSQSRPHPLHPSPPPQNYGFGPPPQHHQRPAHSSRLPNSPAPPPVTTANNDPQGLFPLFCAANSSRSGSLTEAELGSALVNGDYSSFHPRTVRLMIRMFDRDGTQTINFDEFVSLWRYLAAWRELFDGFDRDRSGRISRPEFEDALVAFGYRLSPKFIALIFGVFEAKGKQMSATKDPVSSGMSFDLFVQACISLKRMTDVFKRYDDDRDGYITLSFEEALTGKFKRED